MPLPADLLTRGEYVARAADCGACHTVPGGAPFAGGMAFHMPTGTLYAPNITPDAQAGIGQYSEAEFIRAIRQGIRRDGATLYPAMPYPSYARMTDDDLHALYAYFMHGVRPVPAPVVQDGMHWPLSMRWPLTLWRRLFAPDPAVTLQGAAARTFSDPVVARGAYLVEGPGHCGACHTPRAVTMQEKALTAEDGPLYLSGGAPVDGWRPVSLRGENRTGLGRWSEQDIVRFLATGRMPLGAAFGGMTDAINHGTQHMTADDQLAIARYLKTLSPTTPASAPGWAYDPTAANALHAGDAGARGARHYVDSCAACHRTDGRGYPTTFPPLAGNPVVMDPTPDSLIRIVLEGNTLRATKQAPSAFVMPGFAARMDDAAVADTVSFIRAAWGNDAPAVNAADVARIRRSLSPEHPPATLPMN
ncbi:cytochrome c [Komagataeibacter sp. AV436]|uniref:Cytochrome c n=1 Tax=Komagataeibacter melomenusus TaxID=2766578 RepID=A0ABX2AG97_9PROT|nr:cytochrome c [Komagataeibacter melomenusus]MBV1831297.1 cytochrome c [Komagataeibacter melomenusus]NPC66815.1 cytochrome c [Komagataeibacter melomenusus]